MLYDAKQVLHFLNTTNNFYVLLIFLLYRLAHFGVLGLSSQIVRQLAAEESERDSVYAYLEMLVKEAAKAMRLDKYLALQG